MRTSNYFILALQMLLLLGLLATAGCYFVSTSRMIPHDLGREGGMGTYVGPALPAADVTSGTEQIARYPGSVMVRYVEMNLEEQTGYRIMYLSEDEAAAVADWYKAQLEADGWGKEMDMTTEGTTMLVYNKGGENVQITLSRTEFTSISILYSIEV